MGDLYMVEERVGKVEGRVDKLETWRKETADPSLEDFDVMEKRIDRFLASYESEQKMLRETQEERHKENSEKLSHMNTLMTVGILLVGIFGLILTLASLVIAIVGLKHQSFLMHEHTGISNAYENADY